MTALFGNSARDRVSSKNLVEFRAGKMTMSGKTVSPDKRKGKLYIYQNDDSLMHFCWKERSSSVPEDDLIIFPDDVEFKRVSQCTTGRVYILKFKSSSRKYFFWMQEPKIDKDDEHCQKINEFLNNPPPAGSSSAGTGGNISSSFPGLASLGDQLGDSGLQSLLGNIDRNQLLQMLGMSGLPDGMLDESAAAAAGQYGEGSASRRSAQEQDSESSTQEKVEGENKPTSQLSTEKKEVQPNTSVQSQVQLSDLQNILSNLQGSADGNNASQRDTPVDLASAVNADALAPLLSDEVVQKRLSQYLPEVKDLPVSGEDIKDTIQSPQFKQALSSFSIALQSGQLAPLMQQFQLDEAAVHAASQGDIVSFVKALQKAEETKAKKEGDEIQDDSMNLD